jgi:hypothetical protein
MQLSRKQIDIINVAFASNTSLLSITIFRAIQNARQRWSAKCLYEAGRANTACND